MNVKVQHPRCNAGSTHCPLFGHIVPNKGTIFVWAINQKGSGVTNDTAHKTAILETRQLLSTARCQLGAL